MITVYRNFRRTEKELIEFVKGVNNGKNILSQFERTAVQLERVSWNCR